MAASGLGWKPPVTGSAAWLFTGTGRRTAADQSTGQGLSRARPTAGSATMGAYHVSAPGIYYRAKEFTMTRSQRNKLVAANADLILGGDFAIEEYAVHLSSAIFLLLAGEPGDHSPLSAASPAR